MGEITIRPLTGKDVLGAAEIRVNGWINAYRGIVDDKYLDSLSIKEKEENFKKYIGNDNFVVAIQDDKVVGYCRFVYDNSISPNINYIDCELIAIYAHPDYKGQGIGAKLFNYVVNKFNDLGKNTMILWCFTDNTNAIGFYKHMGGVIKETKKATIGDRNYDEVGIVYDIKAICNNIKRGDQYD